MKINPMLDPNEVIITIGGYHCALIFLTNFGNYIVQIYDLFYKRGSLSDAKSCIDDLETSRRN